MRFLILLILLLSATVGAETLKLTPDGYFLLTKNQVNIGELLADYIRLKKYNVTVDKDFGHGVFEVAGGLRIKPDHIDSLVSSMVAQRGYTMVKFPDSNMVYVLQARDVRYFTLPVYKETGQIPNDNMYSQLVYPLKHIKSEDLARNLRPFLSKYGRIIEERYSKVVYITEQNSNLRRLSEIILLLDNPTYAANMEETEALKKKHETVITKEKGFLEILSSNEIIFILIFFVLGTIIGFGIRGFMMKRIEGGW